MPTPDNRLNINDWREIQIAKENSQHALDKVNDLKEVVTKNNVPSNAVLEVKLDAIMKTLMGNGKKGLIERVISLENWRWYVVGMATLAVVLINIL